MSENGDTSYDLAAPRCTCNDCGGDSNCPCCGARRHTVGLTRGGRPGEWATYCLECSEAAQDWVQVCAAGGWADDPPRSLSAIPAVARAEVAEARLRDLTSRLGFGDGVTEPQADNDTIVRYVEEAESEAIEWRESQRWRDACMLAGHPDDQDCWVHDPALRLEVAEAALARVEELHQPWAHAELSEVCETCSDSAEWEAWQLGEGYMINGLATWPCDTIRALSPDTPTESPRASGDLLRTEALADLLALHDGYHVNTEGWTVCLCGHVAHGDSDDGSHARHVAPLLISHLESVAGLPRMVLLDPDSESVVSRDTPTEPTGDEAPQDGREYRRAHRADGPGPWEPVEPTPNNPTGEVWPCDRRGVHEPHDYQRDFGAYFDVRCPGAPAALTQDGDDR